MNRRVLLLLLLAVFAGLFAFVEDEPAPTPTPTPTPLPKPLPKPRPKRPCPGPGPCPVGSIIIQANRGTKTAPDGSVEITCDLPERERKPNRGGRDGSGLCVFTSIEYAARFQNERRLIDFQAHMTKEPGGGYPSKVDKMIEKYGPGTPYLQYEGKDPSILKQALATGRMPAITFGPAHMVSLVHLDERWACISDNNYVKDTEYLWMTPEEFLRQWKANGSGWAVVLLAPPPPPPPKN